MLYLTSDTHFHHAKILEYCKRPFATVEEMNEEIIKRWNKAVSPTDTIYHLGDFSFGSSDGNTLLCRLNGHKNLILGNHDTNSGITKSRHWESINPYKEVRFEGKKFILCHYAFRVWDRSHHGSYMLYGHSHGSLEGNNQSLDVGVDCWDYTPCSVPQILERMQTLKKYVFEDHHAPKGERHPNGDPSAT